MKIKNISKKDSIYFVELVPTWFEKIFGIVEKTERYKKDLEYKYMFGGSIYYNQNGERLPNKDKIGIGKALDNFDRSF